MAKFIYRVFLVLAIAAAVWGGGHYVMGVRSGENLQNGVELVSNMKETLCRGWIFKKCTDRDRDLFRFRVFYHGVPQ